MQDVTPTESTDLALEGLAPQQLDADVWRIPIPLPFPTPSVNVYLLRGSGSGTPNPSDGWCLVDAPLATAPALAAFAAGLQAAGVAPSDISAIVLTHAHPDHIGTAGRWQRLTGAPVYLLGLEAQLIATLWADPTSAAFLEAGRALVRHGMPPAEAQRLVTQSAETRGLLDLPDHVTLLRHDQRLRLAGGTYRVFWTPGHADGHLCLLREDGLLLAGDHVLPRLVPSVGRYPWSRPDPLADHHASLAAIAAVPARLVLPGHGQPFADLRTRAGELRGAHIRQTTVVARALADAGDGSAAYPLAARLYASRWHAAHSRLLAMAEMVAQLEHLHTLGRAERSVAPDGLVTYTRASETPSPDLRPPDDARMPSGPLVPDDPSAPDQRASA